MKIFETLRDIETIDQLIRLKATGSREQLAARLKKSPRTIHNLLEVMKDMGAPIFYCVHRRSYCYEYEVKLNVGFVIKKEENTKISGGYNLFLKHGNFFAAGGSNFGVSEMIGGC